jgi:hypothetical protein
MIVMYYHVITIVYVIWMKNVPLAPIVAPANMLTPINIQVVLNVS